MVVLLTVVSYVTDKYWYSPEDGEQNRPGILLVSHSVVNIYIRSALKTGPEVELKTENDLLKEFHDFLRVYKKTR